MHQSTSILFFCFAPPFFFKLFLMTPFGAVIFPSCGSCFLPAFTLVACLALSFPFACLSFSSCFCFLMLFLRCCSRAPSGSFWNASTLITCWYWFISRSAASVCALRDIGRFTFPGSASGAPSPSWPASSAASARLARSANAPSCRCWSCCSEEFTNSKFLMKPSRLARRFRCPLESASGLSSTASSASSPAPPEGFGGGAALPRGLAMSRRTFGIAAASPRCLSAPARQHSG
mmetsp:Transcript_90651/g.252121  ORF Transcript_90651/g.252121 Transcript_90651/m.252121 type:complete len:233 (+) Transcript_90651:277-975(+)